MICPILANPPRFPTNATPRSNCNSFNAGAVIGNKDDWSNRRHPFCPTYLVPLDL